jgi:hypothetical protein
MPLIVCTDCNREISDSAPACPHCGKPNEVGSNKELSTVWPNSAQTNKNGSKDKQSSRWVAVVLVIGFVWFISALGDGPDSSNKSVSAPSVAAPQKSQGATSKSAEKVISVKNITDILSAYKNNEVRADNIYKGKIIKVTGIVDSIKKDIMDDLYVTIGTGARFEIPQVQAFFGDSQNSKLSNLNSGENVTVVCRVSGLMMNVIVKDCSIR